MSERRGRGAGFVPAVLAALLLLLAGYAGAYYAMVKPEPLGVEASFGFSDPMVPAYRGFELTLDTWPYRVFAPAHWLDRKLRPKVWEPQPMHSFDLRP